MSTLYVLIDNSTVPRRVGRASICWGAIWEDLTNTPIRVGLMYLNYHIGTNKAFYLGVTKSLEDVFFLRRPNLNIKVMGDCLPVIKQLRGEWRVVNLLTMYKEAKIIIDKFVEYGITPTFEYIEDTDPAYKLIHSFSRQGQSFIGKPLIELDRKKGFS